MNKKQILLHVCCSPCIIYPLQRLKDQGFEVYAYFYNPNIQPKEEYQKRKKTLRDYCAKISLNIDFYPEYSENEFFELIGKTKEKPQRCWACWYLRLFRSAQAARKSQCAYFTSTLLVSPYQDQEKIKELGRKAGEETGVEFYAEDFRSGYQSGVRISKQENMYRQKYCGCSFSLRERESERS